MDGPAPAPGAEDAALPEWCEDYLNDLAVFWTERCGVSGPRSHRSPVPPEQVAGAVRIMARNFPNLAPGPNLARCLRAEGGDGAEAAALAASALPPLVQVCSALSTDAQALAVLMPTASPFVALCGLNSILGLAGSLVRQTLALSAAVARAGPAAGSSDAFFVRQLFFEFDCGGGAADAGGGGGDWRAFERFAEQRLHSVARKIAETRDPAAGGAQSMFSPGISAEGLFGQTKSIWASAAQAPKSASWTDMLVQSVTAAAADTVSNLAAIPRTCNAPPDGSRAPRLRKSAAVPPLQLTRPEPALDDEGRVGRGGDGWREGGTGGRGAAGGAGRESGPGRESGAIEQSGPTLAGAAAAPAAAPAGAAAAPASGRTANLAAQASNLLFEQASDPHQLAAALLPPRPGALTTPPANVKGIVTFDDNIPTTYDAQFLAMLPYLQLGAAGPAETCPARHLAAGAAPTEFPRCKSFAGAVGSSDRARLFERPPELERSGEQGGREVWSEHGGGARPLLRRPDAERSEAAGTAAAAAVSPPSSLMVPAGGAACPAGSPPASPRAARRAFAGPEPCLHPVGRAPMLAVRRRRRRPQAEQPGPAAGAGAGGVHGYFASLRASAQTHASRSKIFCAGAEKGRMASLARLHRHRAPTALRCLSSTTGSSSDAGLSMRREPAGVADNRS